MSTFGHLFRVTTFGESHCKAVGCIVDGVPPGLPLSENDIQPQLDRRRPGQSILTTARNERDQVEILSGISLGKTLGTPIGLLVRNQDPKKIDYANTATVARPGHADYVYRIKYRNHVATTGGGRASARETIARVVAGAIAEKWLRLEYGTEITAWVSSVGPIDLPAKLALSLETNPPNREEVDRLGTVVLDEATTAPTRCPDPETATKIARHVLEVAAAGDSCGGIVTCVAQNVPVGLGEPCFDKMEAELAKAMMSLPATKGFEIGEGFRATRLRGSEHNDSFTVAVPTGKKRDSSDAISDSGDDTTDSSGSGNATLLLGTTNRSGGTLGGISTGNRIVFRVAFKPVSSISLPQTTLDYEGNPTVLQIVGRHDPCVLPRTPPLLEGMTALVIADLALRQRARVGPDPLECFPAEFFPPTQPTEGS